MTVTIDILPNVRVIGQKRDVNSAQSAHFTTEQVEEQPNKRPKKGGDKSAVAIVKSVRQLGCVSQDAEPPESVTISRKGTKVLSPIRRVRFTRAALRQANIRDNKGPSLGKMQVKNSHQRSPYAVKLEDRSQEETERQSDAPAETRGNLPRIFFKLKETEKLHSIRRPMEKTRGMDQQKTKTQTKMTTTRKYEETCRLICKDGHRVQARSGR